MLRNSVVSSVVLVLMVSALSAPSFGQGISVDRASSVLPKGYRDAQIAPNPPSKGGGMSVAGGTDLGAGPVISKPCKDAETNCDIHIKASPAPADGDDDNDMDCVVRVAPSVRLGLKTLTLTWKLNAKQLKKGFLFYKDGVVLDDLSNFSVKPTPSAAMDSVVATLKPHTTAGVVSYTVFLAQNGHTCAGYDPIIVNRDN